LTSEKRASAHTLRAYLHDVEELWSFARAQKGHGAAESKAIKLDDLDVVMCRSYLASLHGRNDAVTIGRKLSSLRAFFRLAGRRPGRAGEGPSGRRAQGPRGPRRVEGLAGAAGVSAVSSGETGQGGGDSGRRSGARSRPAPCRSCRLVRQRARVAAGSAGGAA